MSSTVPPVVSARAAGLELSASLRGTWARAPINGGASLAPGDYILQLVYEVRQPAMWNGRIEAGPLALRVP